jgi:hypothetical protein
VTSPKHTSDKNKRLWVDLGRFEQREIGLENKHILGSG